MQIFTIKWIIKKKELNFSWKNKTNYADTWVDDARIKWYLKKKDTVEAHCCCLRHRAVSFVMRANCSWPATIRLITFTDEFCCTFYYKMIFIERREEKRFKKKFTFAPTKESILTFSYIENSLLLEFVAWLGSECC